MIGFSAQNVELFGKWGRGRLSLSSGAVLHFVILACLATFFGGQKRESRVKAFGSGFLPFRRKDGETRADLATIFSGRGNDNKTYTVILECFALLRTRKTCNRGSSLFLSSSRKRGSRCHQGSPGLPGGEWEKGDTLPW